MKTSTTKSVANKPNYRQASRRSDSFFDMDQRSNEFMATLTHELRNSLAPIMNGLQLLEFMKLGQEAEQVRCMMARQVEQTVHLIDDLLDATKISSGKVLLDKQICVLSTIVEPPSEESSILISENEMTLTVMDDSNASANTNSKHPSRSFRVLVVDDFRAMRIVTKQLLERLGHDVQVAEDGEAAMEKLEAFRPEVVISDIMMPVLGGHDLARRIRERSDMDGVCLVALTGDGQSSDLEMAFDAGFDRHLTKPVDLLRLGELFDDLNSLNSMVW
jgi:CheY-like chemotaxis protein